MFNANVALGVLPQSSSLSFGGSSSTGAVVSVVVGVSVVSLVGVSFSRGVYTRLRTRSGWRYKFCLRGSEYQKSRVCKEEERGL